MRYIGLDFGKKTIGIAVSDEVGLTAQPLTTIRRASIARDLDELVSLIEEYSVEAIVIGLPMNMNGTLGLQSELVFRFIEKLKEKTSVPVSTWDERLSTVAVNRVLIDSDLSRARRKEVVDKVAASYILQGYLDSKGFGAAVQE